MTPPSFDLAEARALLVATPATLRALLAGLPPAWHDVNEGEGTWSPREVLAHLVDGEEVDWIPRARQILAGRGEPFVPFDREGFRSRYAAATVAELLDLFAARRAESLAALDGFALAAADCERTGVHPAFGEVTLAQLLATWAAHDLSHLAQIARVLAKRYADDVGPWRAYLSIFSR